MGLVGGGLLFSNLGAEFVGGFLWNGGFGALVVMRVWVVGLSFICTGRYKMKSPELFSVCILCLGVVRVMFFLRRNWFVLYFFFECSLIPIITLILG